MKKPEIRICTELPSIAIPNDPMVFYNGSKLMVCYETFHGEDTFAVLLFNDIIEYTLTPINDEGLGSHKYFKFGMKFYSIHEIENADEVEKWSIIDTRCWVFCFKDRTLDILGNVPIVITQACDRSTLQQIIADFNSVVPLARLETKENSTWTYLNNTLNTARYALGEKSDHMIACLGINPSTASPNNLDNTMQSVKRIASFNGYSGWVMYNVYAQRATDPEIIHTEIDEDLHKQNIAALVKSIQDLSITTIWIAYGDLIESRPFLLSCMMDLYTELLPLNLRWVIIQEPTLKGHPRHPLYKPTKSSLVDFDMESYVAEVLKPHAQNG